MNEENIEIDSIKNEVKIPKRNDLGLIDGLNYIYDENGYISWRAMIPRKFLYVNPSLSKRKRIEKKYSKNYSEIDPIQDRVEDNDLVTLLAGLKYLLKLRGYNSVRYNIKDANENYASVNCEIEFLPNFETVGTSIIFSDNASASLATTKGFGQHYLVEMATNRSLARCIRNFLSIDVLSKEELEENNDIDDSPQQIVNTIAQYDLLIEIMKKNDFTFDQIKKKCEIEKYEGAENWKTVNDIPKEKVFELIERLKKSKEKSK